MLATSSGVAITYSAVATSLALPPSITTALTVVLVVMLIASAYSVEAAVGSVPSSV